MSINLSYLQVVEPSFAAFFRNVLEEMKVPCRNIVVELTETYLIKELDCVRRIFQNLRSMGVFVAMDDFGTGYSSLGVLKDIPVDIVKIDQTFVRGIQNDAFDATFIRFVVALCHDVGKEVCLEGVETTESKTVYYREIQAGFLPTSPVGFQENPLFFPRFSPLSHKAEFPSENSLRSQRGHKTAIIWKSQCQVGSFPHRPPSGGWAAPAG